MLVTAVAVVVASGGYTLSKAQYLDSYCETRAPAPAATPDDSVEAPTAHLDGPVTVVCEYDAAEPVAVTDPVPLVVRLVAAAIVVGVAFSLARWTRRHAG
ncbi:hypothetical protein ACFP3Q_09325 [Nocardioides sp. GCM10027113]|uniref:hypothetical protein n=1 Tax=unclassified Nocardioides TaxID=2615069 RepID=UPI003608ED30